MTPVTESPFGADTLRQELPPVLQVKHSAAEHTAEGGVVGRTDRAELGVEGRTGRRIGGSKGHTDGKTAGTEGHSSEKTVGKTRAGESVQTKGVQSLESDGKSASAAAEKTLVGKSEKKSTAKGGISTLYEKHNGKTTDTGTALRKTAQTTAGKTQTVSVDSLSVTADTTAAAIPTGRWGTMTMPTGVDSEAYLGGWVELPVMEQPFQRVGVEKVFGENSEVVEVHHQITPPLSSLSEDAAFQGFVLLLAAVYAMLFYYNLSDIRSLFARLSRDTATGGHLSDEPRGSGFARLTHITTTLGVLFCGVMAVKYGDTLLSDSIREVMSFGAVLSLSLMVSAVVLGVVIWQWVMLRIIAEITLERAFVGSILQIRQVCFSLAVVAVSPVLLLFALCPRNEGDIWFFLIIIELAVAAILYLRETFNLFISKKISILHWFLYLCTVEIFPISLLWLIFIRN